MFIGYAIIQLPELFLFLYKQLLNKLELNGSFKREDKNYVRPKLTEAKLDADKNEKNETKILSILERLSKVEQNDTRIFKKLDEKMTAIDDLK